MARRWTPHRFVAMRRVRVAVCAVAVTLASVLGCGFATRKTVALDINGQTTTVVTYATTVARLLEDQGVNVRSHDQIATTSGELRDHDVVTVRSAYQTTITIDGQEVPFWTVATSAEQLLGFFEANADAATKVTVDIGNVYNRLTGGLVINEDGPVTVIADGQSSVAPDGRLPAASILDAKGITLNREDRVSVEKDGGETILRVRRVTHGQETRTESVPFTTQTVIDPSLAPGETVIRQEGENGEIQRVFDVTYVDGVPESETMVSQTTTTIAIDRIVAVGPEVVEEPQDDADGQADAGDDAAPEDQADGDDQPTDAPDRNDQDDAQDVPQDPDDGDAPAEPSGGEPAPDDGDAGGSQDQGSGGSNESNGSGGSGSTGSDGSNGSTGSDSQTPDSGGSSTARLWHPTIAQAQAYAGGAAAQYGWTGDEWDALVWLWDHESGWRWNADNPWSDAYGIPQALPGSKMGPGWQDDGAVQIDWGLSYIAQRYGSPTQAVAFWQQHNWY